MQGKKPLSPPRLCRTSMALRVMSFRPGMSVAGPLTSARVVVQNLEVVLVDVFGPARRAG